VVLQMREANAWPSRVVVTDLLPAGFVIDNPRLVGSAELGNFPWLGGFGEPCRVPQRPVHGGV
jgi:uncharacterized protein YfaS (alpha-2-macroglobulin family)